MPNYDEEQLGLNNPSHPANEIEVFDEVELTSNELMIQFIKNEITSLKKEHESIKGILKQIEKMEYEQGIYATCLGMTEQQEKDYIHLRNCLRTKIIKL